MFVLKFSLLVFFPPHFVKYMDLSRLYLIIFGTNFFRSHYDPGVDSASNRNEYQVYFVEVKAAGA